jgi:transposase
MFFLKDRLDKETLERLHVRDGLSYAEIAERFGTRSGNVTKLMEEYGIPRRIKRARRTGSSEAK